MAYHGFPIDTGSVVALKLLNPDNAVPAGILSSNVYSDRAETVVFGKAARDAIEASGKKVAVVGPAGSRLWQDTTSLWMRISRQTEEMADPAAPTMAAAGPAAPSASRPRT